MSITALSLMKTRGRCTDIWKQNHFICDRRIEMKNRKMKMVSLIFVLTSLFLSFNVMPVAAATGIDANGFTWQSDDGVTYSITGYTGSATNITIPSSIDGHSVTSIGLNAFRNTSITSVTIPDTVVSIGGFAFYYCTSLVSVVIPDSVTSIGESAFAYCTSLPNITLPDNLNKIENCAFQDCKAFTSITIPSSVKSIGFYAFLECFSLKSITIPNSVTSIGEGAFKDCKLLNNVVIPDSVTSVGNYLFYNCTSLSDVRLSNSLTNTGNFIFYNCSSLKGVTLPDSLTNIGNSAFEDCTALTSIAIPNGVINIGHRAFIMCQALSNVTIPNSVKTIDFNAFAHCYSFTDIKIPDSVTSIGDYAFYYCKSLASITVPSSVTSIGFLTFDSCNLSLVMKGYSGSYAQSYAASNSLNFYDLYKDFPYTVTYDSSGGSAVASQSAIFNMTVSALTTSTRAGYTFNGWYTVASGGSKVSYPYTVKGNVTLYAQWTSLACLTTSNISATAISFNTIRLKWNVVSGASGYKIYRATVSNGIYSLIITTSALSYTNNDLHTGTTYYYKVMAYQIVGKTVTNSKYSSIVSAKPVLAAPTSVKAAKSTTTSATISWNAVSGASGYTVYRATSAAGVYSAVKNTSSTSFNNSGLSKGKTYYYKIAAYRMVGSTKVYSRYSMVVYAKM